MSRPCPKCKSSPVTIHEEDGLSFLQCRKCQYNELGEATGPEVRKTQREKGRYSPYQKGGSRRTKKY